jgi:hypothetical protein
LPNATRSSSTCSRWNLTRCGIIAGTAALRWLVEGYGYEVTGLDVSEAYSFTIKAAEDGGIAAETHERMRTSVAAETFGERFVTRILWQRLGL